MATKTTGRLAPGIYRLAGGGYRVKVAVGDRKRGGLQRETTFASDTGLKEMKAWQTQTRAEFQRSGLLLAKGTLESDVPRYMDRVRERLDFPKDRESAVRAWLARFGHRRRHTITKSEIKEQVRDWVSEAVAASTIRKRMTALSTLFNELDGDEAFNPLRGIKRPKEPDPRSEFQPPEVILSVLEALAFRVTVSNRGWKTLARAMLLTYTGTRPSQMMRIQPVVDVLPYLDGPTPMIFIRPGKRGKAHWKPMPPGGVAAMHLFVNTGAEGKFSTSSFYKSWMKACDDAGVVRFNPYNLRHSYATLMRRGGADIADIQELLGHKSPKTTQRYAMVIPEKLITATKHFQSVWRKGRA